MLLIFVLIFFTLKVFRDESFFETGVVTGSAEATSEVVAISGLYLFFGFFARRVAPEKRRESKNKRIELFDLRNIYLLKERGKNIKQGEKQKKEGKGGTCKNNTIFWLIEQNALLFVLLEQKLNSFFF